jgi:hypothetical protein
MIGNILGDGNTIDFWKEKWCGAAPLGQLFPNLFAKESDHNGVIAKRLVGNNFNREWGWSWCSELTAIEEEELQDLQHILFGVSLVEASKDNWR